MTKEKSAKKKSAPNAALSIETGSEIPSMPWPSLTVILCEKSKLKRLSLNLKKASVEVAERVQKLLDLQVEEPKEGALLIRTADTKLQSDVAIFVLPKSMGAFELQQWARDHLKASLKIHHEEICFLGFEKSWEKLVAYCLSLALGARTFAMPLYGKKQSERKIFKLKRVHLVSSAAVRTAFERGSQEIFGTNLVRELGFTPPNELNSESYGRRIQELCKAEGLVCKFHSAAQLKKMGAGAFTAVDRGDPESKGGIWEIEYSGRGAKNKKPIVFVGKGLCFDTGGYDVKTNGMMATMKGDMQGSAVALASIVLAKRMQWPLKIKAFLAVTENHISPRAYKADEVVTALNGISIEIIHTDAEGRMVLADTLCLASQEKPELIMDFATLTGSAVRAIGTAYAAAFVSEDRLGDRVLNAGRDSGERVWVFPMPKDYAKFLESEIADTIQCSKSAGIDHILAAIFLKKFVGEGIDWVHIDLAAAENKGGYGPTDTEFTGFGSRFALEFLRKTYKLGSA